MYQRTAQSQFLFHASREFPRPAVLKGFYLLVNVFYQVVVFLDGGTEYCSEEVEVFFDGEVLVQAEFARHIADAFSYLPVVFYDVEAIDGGGAFICQQEGRQYPEEGCLAGAVGADEAEQFAGVDGEGDIPDRGDSSLVIGFLYVVEGDHGCCFDMRDR